jgi:hypothetical protein
MRCIVRVPEDGRGARKLKPGAKLREPDLGGADARKVLGVLLVSGARPFFGFLEGFAGLAFAAGED